jgi:hypothetical protein
MYLSPSICFSSLSVFNLAWDIDFVNSGQPVVVIGYGWGWNFKIARLPSSHPHVITHVFQRQPEMFYNNQSVMIDLPHVVTGDICHHDDVPVDVSVVVNERAASSVVPVTEFIGREGSPRRKLKIEGAKVHVPRALVTLSGKTGKVKKGGRGPRRTRKGRGFGMEWHHPPRSCIDRDAGASFSTSASSRLERRTHERTSTVTQKPCMHFPTALQRCNLIEY